MIISIAIAILLLLTSITGGFLAIFFRSYPGFRISIESILIKIGGLCFGPIIGMFIGAVTDLLSIFLTAGMFHYGYFLAAIFFGFFSGIINLLLTKSKFQMRKFVPVGCILMIVCVVPCMFFTYIQTTEVINISIMGMDIVFHN
jgi:LytS/YehU family sensor histidine kinase